MNKILIVPAFYFLSLIIACTSAVNQKENIQKPRLIITTDIGGDPDDQQSLTRLLCYANEFEIEALIASASGTPGELKKDTVKDQLTIEYIMAYEKVLPNLRKHAEGFPEAELLLKRIKKGNPQRGNESIGEGKDTEASECIIEIVDRKDDRKVNIAIWGGQTDFVQALWKVKSTRDYEAYLDFISRIRIYDIADQDGLYPYIRKEFPELFYVLSKAPHGTDKREAAFRGMYYGGDESLTSFEWVNSNVRKNHDALGALYPEETWTAPNPHGVLKEGDTPSWFYFLMNGLQDPEHPEYGGWGGRFEKDSAKFYRDASDFAGAETHPRATVYRWREYFQNEFAARMDWCVEEYEQANHSPVILVNGKKSDLPIVFNACAGQELTFKAVDSYDPDGDDLDFYWWTYPEAGTNSVCPELENYLSPQVSFLVPEGEEGGEIHLICEVNDNGEPILTSFQRIIIRIEQWPSKK
jgi:hypothetical protein